MNVRDDRLADALRNIKTATNWYWACAGQISRDDMRHAMDAVRHEIDSVNDLLFPASVCEEQFQPMNNEF